MTDTLKKLGAAAPSATTEADLYTVSDLTQTTTSSLWVCNRSSSATTFRVSVTSGGGATGNEDYLFYDTPLDGNQTVEAVSGLSLSATDVVRVYAGAATVSFNLFGVETSG